AIRQVLRDGAFRELQESWDIQVEVVVEQPGAAADHRASSEGSKCESDSRSYIRVVGYRIAIHAQPGVHAELRVDGPAIRHKSCEFILANVYFRSGREVDPFLQGSGNAKHIYRTEGLTAIVVVVNEINTEFRVVLSPGVVRV